MTYARRIFLFLLVNIFVIATINIVLSLTGLNRVLYQHGVGLDSLFVYCFIWGMGGAFISLAISRFMAKMAMGVELIDPTAANGRERQLVETVHSFARKVGINVMPQVGIYDSPEVNAFATGPTKNRALVAVSSGLLNSMDQNQVEGVLGHEISHIANGDMVTMTLVQGVVNAFVLFLSHIITRIIDMALRDRNGRGGLSFFAYAIAFNLISVLLSFLAFPIVAWVSRQREYRADAGSARVAGREKMVSALKALQGTTKLIDPSHKELATLKITDRPSGFMAFFSTHPSLDDRIRRLETGMAR